MRRLHRGRAGPGCGACACGAPSGVAGLAPLSQVRAGEGPGVRPPEGRGVEPAPYRTAAEGRPHWVAPTTGRTARHPSAALRAGRCAPYSTASLLFLLLTLPLPAWAKAHLEGNWVVVDGLGNTLASVARDIGDPAVISFEPAIGLGRLSRSLRLRGELTVGAHDEWDSLLKHSTILQLDVTQCGQARIEVERGPQGVGVLRLVRTKLESIHRTRDLDQCKDPNLLTARGKVILDHSTITANIDGHFLPEAEVRLAGSTFSLTRSTGLWFQGLDAALLHVADSFSVDNALYGLRLEGIRGPLTIRNSVFRGLKSDVYLSGPADLTLVDCDLKTTSITSPQARLVQRWTVTVHTPQPGMVVEARSAEGTGRSEVVRGRADGKGVCRLALAEYELTQAAPEPRAGVNRYTPHDLTIYDPQGATPQFEVSNLYVFMPGQEVRLP